MIHEKPGRVLSIALQIPARVFAAAAKVRGLLFDKGTLEIVDTKVPVISIGNLTAGGTGKTPITSYLAADLRTRGLLVGIVSRGYGGTESGPALVAPDATSETAARFGDEPTWLASRHPESLVVIGRERPEAVLFLNSLFESKTPSAPNSPKLFGSRRVVLADDAFQHRRLKRDIDIVVIDPTEPRWHYQPLPLGRMREGFSALKRADFVFLSKSNLLPAKDLEWIRERLHKEQVLAKFKIVEFGVKLSGAVSLESNRSREPARPLTLLRVVLMSGIARPETFETMVQQSVRAMGVVEVLGHFKFPDHHAYTANDLANVEAAAFDRKAQAIIITEKDAVKLVSWTPQVPVFVTRLVAEPLTDFQEFHEAVDRLG